MDEDFLGTNHMSPVLRNLRGPVLMEFCASQRGLIGITVSVSWYVPLGNSSQDVDAVQRALEFYVGW